MSATLFHGYELLGDWKNSSSGKIAKSQKGGKMYFLKKYQTPVAPINNGTLDPKTFAHNQKQFNDFVDLRKRVNTAIRTIAGPGGNIVIPSYEFIDGNQYVEASEFVDGIVKDDDLEGVLAGLATDVKKLLMQTAAGALFSIHSKGIIHSDLKLKNVLLVKKSTGNYVAKLVDFDSSYFEDRLPEEIVGDINYYSPELGAYADAEDEKEELGKKITVKSDIFSLGLIFHFYLSGALPTPSALTEKLRKRKEKGKIIYCWVALNNGCELQISPKIKSPKYVSLIKDMLSLEPAARPSASDILRRLREAETAAAPSASVSSSVRRSAPSGFCAPWSDDMIVFDIDKIKTRGFVSIEQAVLSGIKGYKFYRSDSNSVFFKRSDLLAMRYAKTIEASESASSEPAPEPAPPRSSETPAPARSSETPAPVEETTPDASSKFATPWPEHNIVFDEEAIRKKGYVKVEQSTLGGVKGYTFTRSNGATQFIRLEMVLIQKMARKS